MGGEREGSKSKHRSRNSIGSHGSIKDMGLQRKIIDKMFFCMDRNSRIGLFFSTGVVIEVLGLVSLVSTIMLLIKIGFPLQAVILLLLSYIGVAIFFLQTRGAKLFGAETGPKKWATNLGL